LYTIPENGAKPDSPEPPARFTRDDPEIISDQKDLDSMNKEGGLERKPAVKVAMFPDRTEYQNFWTISGQ
jgi:hypothetical protein